MSLQCVMRKGHAVPQLAKARLGRRCRAMNQLVPAVSEVVAGADDSANGFSPRANAP